CQIHDWDGDGHNEVVLCTRGAIVELDGATGTERRRIAIPDEATDCLVFCDLRGSGRAGEVLVKDRYRRIWAYAQDGSLLWHVTDPGGCRTAHQPRPMDLDGDGRDEIMAGYALLGPDGTVRWTFASKAYPKVGGHLDCARVVHLDADPSATRIAITCCGGNDVALLDGRGEPAWEITGHHFESVDVGRVFPEVPGPQLVVDVDHQPVGKSPLWVLDRDGQLLARITTPYSRHHCLLDWDGDGADEILVGHTRTLYDHSGRRLAMLRVPSGVLQATPRFNAIVASADMTGNGVPDALVVTTTAVFVFRNTKGQRPATPAPLGTGKNYTLY
ncbi:MAG: hypothetical protein JXR77_14010, partial [Lentisphaeria bacterium]|nr:hypothetical protein [Lentisphaeria bacterium]